MDGMAMDRPPGKKGKVSVLDRLLLVEVRLEQTKMLGMEKV